MGPFKRSRQSQKTLSAGRRDCNLSPFLERKQFRELRKVNGSKIFFNFKFTPASTR